MRARRRHEERERAARLERHVDSVAREAGFRVLRELGDGGRSLVCLVVPLDADPFHPFDRSRAALKVPRFGATDLRRVREDRVLASVRSPHVVALLGTPDQEASALVLEYLPGGTLADLLTRRGFLRVGEAVTILVSMVRALTALHAAGWWHGSLSASKVMFAADGRPVVVGLSHAVATGVARAADGTAPVAAPDSDGFREIVDLVSAAVGDTAIVPAALELRELARAGLPSSMSAAAWQQLESRIFRVSRPEPVMLTAPSAALVPSPTRFDDGGAKRPVLGGGAGWVRTVLTGEPVARLTRLVREKRKLIVFSAVCTLIVCVVAVAAVAEPPTNGRGRTDSTAGSAAAPSALDAMPTTTPEAPSGRQGSTAVLGASPPQKAEKARQDDPVDAAAELLRVRFECFSVEPVDPRCLDAVVQPGSAIEAEDRAALRARTADPTGERLDFRDHEVSLLERMGDAALIALTPSTTGPSDARGAQTKPASLLIVRGEAGWRLRELFAN